MLIRPLIRKDLPAVAEIVGQTFSHDELFSWLYPKQDQYPDDLRRYQVIRLRTRLVSRGCHGFVAASEEGDAEWNGRPIILGFAFYIREGTGDKAVKWRCDSIFNRVERYLLSWELWYEAKFLDRVSDPSRVQSFGSATEFGFYTQLSDHWHLGLLGVSPLYQRRGVGTMLVAYGQGMAADDGVPVTLEASVVGHKLYEKLGFLEIERMPLKDDLEAVAMLWEPKEASGAWLVRGDDGKAAMKSLRKDEFRSVLLRIGNAVTLGMLTVGILSA